MNDASLNAAANAIERFYAARVCPAAACIHGGTVHPGVVVFRMRTRIGVRVDALAAHSAELARVLRARRVIVERVGTQISIIAIGASRK